VDPQVLKIARRRMTKAGVNGVELVSAPAERKSQNRLVKLTRR
jgi:hypothetical protein